VCNLIGYTKQANIEKYCLVFAEQKYIPYVIFFITLTNYFLKRLFQGIFDTFLGIKI